MLAVSFQLLKYPVGSGDATSCREGSMTIYHKDAKKSGYASPREVSALKAENENMRGILVKLIEHPLVSNAVEDENADLLQIVKEACSLVARLR